MSLVHSFLDQVLFRLESDVKFLTGHGFISKTDSEMVLGVFSRVGSEKTSSKKKKHTERESAEDIVLSPEAEPERVPPPPDTNNLGSGSDRIAEPITLNKSPSSTSLNKSSSNESLNQLVPDWSPDASSATTTLNKSTSVPSLKKHPHIPPPNPRATFPIPSIDLGKRPLPPPPPRPVPVGPQCKAIWDYEAESDSDLPFKEGDIIQIVSEDDADWWVGRLNGREGLIPSNRVEKMFTPSPRRVHAPPPFPIPRIPRRELDSRL